MLHVQTTYKGENTWEMKKKKTRTKRDGSMKLLYQSGCIVSVHFIPAVSLSVKCFGGSLKFLGRHLRLSTDQIMAV